jgi:hypothetical protein
VSYSLEIRPDALADIAEAATWYDEQLVVEIHNTQAFILPVTRTLRVPNPDDKLKHIGH